MTRNKLILGLMVVVGAGLWGAFRPERLFVNAKVNESLGAVQGDASKVTFPRGLRDELSVVF